MKGPVGVEKELGEIDAVAGDLIDFYEARGSARDRALRVRDRAGLAAGAPEPRAARGGARRPTGWSLGREVIDIGGSEAFAMADHQLSHVYVRDPARVNEVKALLEKVPGVGEVLDEAGKREYGLDHERSGELVLIAEPDSWFTYYYWLDDAKAPDYARTVDIHRKPGYDPVELFLDPAIKRAAARARLAAGAQEARLPHADGRDPARRDAGSRVARADPRRPVEGPAADDPAGRPAARRRASRRPTCTT